MSRKTRHRAKGRSVADRPSWPLAAWLATLVIALATFLAFLPTLQNGFVRSWDDGTLLLENPHYRGLGWPHLRWMFTSVLMGHWIPLTRVSFGLDYVLWGMNPAGYHLTSLLLHVANAILVYAIALGLLRHAATGFTEPALVVGAAVAALVFGVHPLRVESVAWATERKDVLSGFWFLLTLWTYLEAAVSDGSARARWLALSVGCYLLAILSKAMVMTLPLVLVVLDVYPLRRLGWPPRTWLTAEGRRIWIEKIPYVLLALVVAGAALYALTSLIAPAAAQSLPVRLGIAAYSLWFNVWGMLIPIGLSPLYEAPVPLDPWEARFLASAAAVLVISGGVFLLRRRWPALAAVWVSYGVMLAPVSGLFQTHGPQLVADRYSYLPCVGFAIVAGSAGAAMVQALTARSSVRRWAFLGVAIVVGWLAGLGVLTWKQVHVWRDAETLWSHVVTHDPRSSVGHNNLGLALRERGDLAGAGAHIREALGINPAYPEARANLATVLVRQGRLDEAIGEYTEAVRLRPTFAEAHNDLGLALGLQGKLDEAIPYFRHAAALAPELADPHYNLGNVLMRRQQWNEATAHFRAAIRARPTYAEAHNNLGTILASQGRVGEAIAHFRRALDIDPAYRKARNNLDRALALQDR